MEYGLGVDLGTTWTAAALAREGRIEVCSLESHSTVTPSLVHLDESGSWAFGEAALALGERRPDGLAREFKRSMGDVADLVLSGRPVGVPELMAKLLAWVVGTVERAEHGRPSQVALTHPAHWSGPQRNLLRTAVSNELPDLVVGLLSEPEAIAVHVATTAPLDDGLVAVYDFGGGTFDATILEARPSGFRVVGEPEGRDRIGGIDLDDVVMTWALEAIGRDTVSRLDRADPVVRSALQDLKDRCRAAKIALSADTEATIVVHLPTHHDELRLTRGEFESMARGLIDETASALEQACATAEIEPADLSTILLAGGSSQVPLVAETLARRFPTVPVSHAGHAKLSVAQGAATTLLPPAERPKPEGPAMAPEPAIFTTPGPQPEPQGGADIATPVTTATAAARSRPPWLVAVPVILIALVVGFFVLWPSGPDDEAALSTTTTAATADPATSTAGADVASPALVPESELDQWKAEIVDLFDRTTGSDDLRNMLAGGIFWGGHEPDNPNFDDLDCRIMEAKLRDVGSGIQDDFDDVPRTGAESVYPSLEQIGLRDNLVMLLPAWIDLYTNCVCDDADPDRECLVPAADAENAGLLEYGETAAGMLQTEVLTDICLAFDSDTAGRFTLDLREGLSSGGRVETLDPCG